MGPMGNVLWEIEFSIVFLCRRPGTTLGWLNDLLWMEAFVVRIILKLVKRLFELKIWPSSLPFQVQPVSAHFRLCGISASMFFEDWFLSVFPWVFPWIFDQPTHPDTDLVHRKFHMKIRTLRIKPRSRLGLRWLFWPMRKWGFHSEK